MIRHRHKTQRPHPYGFTLLEVLLVVAITSTIMCVMLKLFIDIGAMADLADSKTMAYTEIQNILEEMRHYDFDDLATDYASGGTVGNTFTPAYLTGKGNIAISGATSTQLTATLTVCWRERTGRIVGEDTDLDGTLDAGEDANGNGTMDSPVQVTAIIANYD